MGERNLDLDNPEYHQKPSIVRRPSRGPNNLNVFNHSRAYSECCVHVKTVLAIPSNVLVTVLSRCFCCGLCWEEISSWLYACAVLLYGVLIVCIPFPFALRKLLRVQSVISINGHYISVL